MLYLYPPCPQKLNRRTVMKYQYVQVGLEKINDLPVHIRPCRSSTLQLDLFAQSSISVMHKLEPGRNQYNKMDN